MIAGSIRTLLSYAKELKEHFAKSDTYIDIWEDTVKKYPKNVCYCFSCCIVAHSLVLTGDFVCRADLRGVRRQELHVRGGRPRRQPRGSLVRQPRRQEGLG